MEDLPAESNLASGFLRPMQAVAQAPPNYLVAWERCRMIACRCGHPCRRIRSRVSAEGSVARHPFPPRLSWTRRLLARSLLQDHSVGSYQSMRATSACPHRSRRGRCRSFLDRFHKRSARSSLSLFDRSSLRELESHASHCRGGIATLILHPRGSPR